MTVVTSVSPPKMHRASTAGFLFLLLFCYFSGKVLALKRSFRVRESNSRATKPTSFKSREQNLNTTGTASCQSNPAHCIPRGKNKKGTKRNSLGLLKRQADINAKRIRGMIPSVKDKSNRQKLMEIRRELLGVLQRITDAPCEVSDGTFAQVEEAIQEARQIYARAPKPKNWGRSERRTEVKGIGKKEGRRMRREEGKPVAEKVVAAVASAIPPWWRHDDSKGDAFQAEIDEGRPNE